MILSEVHLRRVLRANVAYFNRARPQRGTGQAIPAGASPAERQGVDTGRIVALPIRVASITTIVMPQDRSAGPIARGCAK